MPPGYKPAPENRYGQIASRLMCIAADCTRTSVSKLRRVLRIRGDREWAKVVEGKGKAPSSGFHDKLKLGLPSVAEKILKELYPNADMNKSAGLEGLRKVIDELDAVFKSLPDSENDSSKTIFLSNTATVPKVLSYAPEDRDRSRSETQDATHALNAAQSAGDTKGAKLASAAIAAGRKQASKINKAELDAEIEFNHQRMKLARERGDAGELILALDDTAAIYERIADWPHAVPELRRLIRAQKKVHDAVFSFRAHARLARALAGAGRERQALKILRSLRSHHRWEQSRRLDAKTAARVAERFAQLCIKNGRLSEARHALKAAQRIRENIGNPVGIGSVAYYRSQLEARAKRWAHAHAELEACGHCWHQLHIAELDARVHLMHARFYRDATVDEMNVGIFSGRKWRLKRALQEVNRALKKFGRASMRGEALTEYASAHELRGSIRYLLGDSPKKSSVAAEDYEHALNLTFDPFLRGWAHGALAELKIRCGDSGGAAKHAKISYRYLGFCHQLARSLRTRLQNWADTEVHTAA